MSLSLTNITQKYVGKLVHSARKRRDLDEHFFHLRKEYDEARIASFEELAAGLTDIIYGLITKSIKLEDISQTLKLHDWQQLIGMPDDNFLLKNEQISMLAFDNFKQNKTSLSMMLESAFKRNKDDNSRISLFQHNKFKSAQIIVYKLGMQSNPNYSFGLNIIAPKEIDRLLWWAFTENPIREKFCSPDDLESQLWITKPSQNLNRERLWGRTILGMQHFQLGPSLGGTLFSSIPFEKSISEANDNQAGVKTEGTIISYFHL